MLRSIIPVLVCLLLAGSAAPAQRRPNRPGAAAASIAVITRTINDCENSTDRFVRSLRRALNQSGSIDSSREDSLNRSARELERSMDRVGDSWNRDKDPGKTRRHVRAALNDARNINLTMRSRRLRPETEELWREVRVQMNLLARAFDLPALKW